jgi:hypothetical protein
MATRRKPSSEESSATQTAQKRVALYVPSHAGTITDAEQQERLEIIERIPENADAAITYLTTTNYQVDRSIREATLAKPDQWQEESEMLVFTSSDKIKIYLGTPRDPLEMSEALKRIRELSESTALTARIVLGLWNIRRSNNQLTVNGSVAIRLEEVLEWRGIKKHSYLAYPDKPGSTKRYTDGYESKHRDQVLKDLDLLASCCVRGRVNCSFRGKRVEVSINGPYLNYSIVMYKTLWAEDTIAGVFASPGDWISAYAEYDNHFFSEIDRKIFQFHPHKQQHELRLALYLTERWRQLAREGNFEKEISMNELLAASMIRIDKGHLTSQFAPRIEQALHELWQHQIIGGKEPAPIEEVDKSQPQWGKAWLASRWIIPPPPEVQEFYAKALKPSQPQSLPHGTRKKGRAVDTSSINTPR